MYMPGAMRRNLILIAMILLQMCSCATYRSDNADRMQTLPQHYAEFDLKLAWEVKPDGSSTVIDGVVKNIRYYQMDELEIWVLSLDAEGKVVHRAADFVYSLKENEVAQFTLSFPGLPREAGSASCIAISALKVVEIPAVHCRGGNRLIL
jgi:hypothetical protein